MKRVINGSEWADLIANGNPHRGRFYCMDPDHQDRGYLVFNLATEKMPKNLHDLPPRTLKQENNRLYYERRKQRRARV